MALIYLWLLYLGKEQNKKWQVHNGCLKKILLKLFNPIIIYDNTIVTNKYKKRKVSDIMLSERTKVQALQRGHGYLIFFAKQVIIVRLIRGNT